MSVTVTLPDDTTKVIKGANIWRWETDMNISSRAGGGLLFGGGKATSVGVKQSAETHRIVTVGWKKYVMWDEINPVYWSGYAKSVELKR